MLIGSFGIFYTVEDGSDISLNML